METNKPSRSTKVFLKDLFTNKALLLSLCVSIFLLILFHIFETITLPGIKLPADYANAENSFEGMLNLLAGGGLSRMSLFAVGVGPYITAQIITQLLSSDLIPSMSRMAKGGERGKRKLEIITRIITVPFCVAQSYAVVALILNNNGTSADPITIFGVSSLSDLSATQMISLILLFTAGTYICIFIADMITKRGVGNGITLLILVGIVSSLLSNFEVAFQHIASKIGTQDGSIIHTLNVVLSCMLYVLFFVIILCACIFVNGSTRKIPIQQTGQGLTTNTIDLPFLPIKLNSAGVIPVIFASSIMTIPGTIAQFLSADNDGKLFIEKYLIIESYSGLSLYFVLIILFTFFYSYVQINPSQLSENFEKSGRFIPGIKTGKDTEKHITKVLNRIN
jgi:preprotein translocase subunit SecY